MEKDKGKGFNDFYMLKNIQEIIILERFDHSNRLLNTNYVNSIYIFKVQNLFLLIMDNDFHGHFLYFKVFNLFNEINQIFKDLNWNLDMIFKCLIYVI
jgi:hypothetical protein